MKAEWAKSVIALEEMIQTQQAPSQGVIPSEASGQMDTSASGDKVMELDGRVQKLQEGLQKLQEELAAQNLKNRALTGVWDTTVLRLGQIEQRAVSCVEKSVKAVARCRVACSEVQTASNDLRRDI
jgi:hypothetical protein